MTKTTPDHDNLPHSPIAAINGTEHAPPTDHAREERELLPALQEFKDYIDSNSDLHLHFNQMWHQSPPGPFNPSSSGHVTVRSYEHMLSLLDTTLRSTPTWTRETFLSGTAGLPICEIFFRAVATRSGRAAFADPGVARRMKGLLDSWAGYLSCAGSAPALSRTWLSPSAGLPSLCAVANAPYRTALTFEELFVCEPAEADYGFASWDDFFVRRFRPGVRPVAGPEDDGLVANACESRRYELVRGVEYEDRFWAKGSAYSLKDILEEEELARAFVGGTIYQAFLSQYSYHRWHAPVSGTVRHAYTLEGTYFTVPEFHDVESKAREEVEGKGKEKKVREFDIEKWQAWLACQATRGIITIDADNPKLGLVGFVAVGMVEVSSIDVTVKVGQRVKKGDELGMFHFGGSSHCVLFQKGVDLEGFPAGPPEREENVPVRGSLARLRV